MGSIYHCTMDSGEEKVLEELRSKIANIAGVTLTGNRLTVRWYQLGRLVDVHMIIESVTTPEEASQQLATSNKVSAFLQGHPEFEDELYFIEHGEWPK